jgi:hypothetical protein
MGRRNAHNFYLLERLMVSQMTKAFSAFYGTRGVITVLRNARHSSECRTG